MTRDDDYIRIPCKKCVSDIGKPPVLSEFYIQMKKKRRGDFNLIQDRPRCLNCLKYLARDSTNVGEDEVAKLKECSGCEIAKYCSVGDCQDKHFLIHKWLCKPKNDFSIEDLAWKYNSLILTNSHDGQVVPKNLSEQEFCEMDLLQVNHCYVQGILSLNGALLDHFLKNSYNDIMLNEFIDPRIKATNHTLTNVVCAAFMFRGDWEFVWEYVKLELYRSCHNFTTVVKLKNIVECGSHDNIIVALKKDGILLDTTSFIAAEEQECIVYNYAYYMMMAAVVKINVIENMKLQLRQYNEHIRKTRPRKRFFHRPRILNCITLYILGKEVNAFEKDILEQEKHLNDIFQVLNNIYIGHRAVGSLQLLEVFSDDTKCLSLEDKVWANEKKACNVEQYVTDSNFIWNYYFSINPAAVEYVKKFLKPHIQNQSNESKDKLMFEFHERLRTGKTYMCMSEDSDKLVDNEVS